MTTEQRRLGDAGPTTPEDRIERAVELIDLVADNARCQNTTLLAETAKDYLENSEEGVEIAANVMASLTEFVQTSREAKRYAREARQLLITEGDAR